MTNPDLPDFSEMTRREIEDYLVERAMIDPEFRHQLLETPEKLLRELGLPLGEDVKIQVLEEKPKSFYLILPRALRELDELDESELDQVTGGVSQTGTFRFFKGYT